MHQAVALAHRCQIERPGRQRVAPGKGGKGAAGHGQAASCRRSPGAMKPRDLVDDQLADRRAALEAELLDQHVPQHRRGSLLHLQPHAGFTARWSSSSSIAWSRSPAPASSSSRSPWRVTRNSAASSMVRSGYSSAEIGDHDVFDRYQVAAALERDEPRQARTGAGRRRNGAARSPRSAATPRARG